VTRAQALRVFVAAFVHGRSSLGDRSPADHEAEEAFERWWSNSRAAAELRRSLVVCGRGATVDIGRLHSLAFTDHDRTDHERELRSALQDALVLAQLYRDGAAEVQS
jgi:hypothetical protein